MGSLEQKGGGRAASMAPGRRGARGDPRGQHEAQSRSNPVFTSAARNTLQQQQPALTMYVQRFKFPFPTTRKFRPQKHRRMTTVNDVILCQQRAIFARAHCRNICQAVHSRSVRLGSHPGNGAGVVILEVVGGVRPVRFRVLDGQPGDGDLRKGRRGVGVVNRWPSACTQRIHVTLASGFGVTGDTRLAK